LFRHRARSLLTVVGISIGIATIVTLGLITEGLKGTVEEAIKAGKADFSIAQTGVVDLILSTIKQEELQEIQKMKGIKNAVGVLIASVPVSFNPYFISIMGPSGSGKSTLLNMIAALDTPDAGDILVEGKSLLNEIKDVASYRARTAGFIFQLHNLLPHLTALENILIPMFEVKASKEEKIRRAQKLLEEIGLKDRMRSFPPELSGGERQKVAIARALANNPRILLADEPTGNVDSKSSQQILRLFKEFRQRNKVAMILVTHDSLVARTGERIVHISDGKISS